MEQFNTMLKAAECAVTRCNSWSFATSDKKYDKKSLMAIAEVSDAENPADEYSFYVVSPGGAIDFCEDGGGNELKLSLQIRIADKNLPSYDYDSLSVTLDGGTFNTTARSFPSVRSFAVVWKSLNDFQHSLIYKKTGFSEITSWIERKK